MIPPEYRECSRCGLFVRGGAEEPQRHPCPHATPERPNCAPGCAQCEVARRAERIERAKR